MTYPVSTGRAAELVGSTEPRLAELVRHGKVRPQPWIVAGRRLWFAEQIIQAAEALGVLTPELQEKIERSAPRGGSALGRYSPQAETAAPNEQEVEHAS